jgi:serine/threonine protein kinase
LPPLYFMAGRYRATRRLGEGAFGEVLAGEDTQTGAAVALKRVFLKDAGAGCEYSTRARLLRGPRRQF